MNYMDFLGGGFAEQMPNPTIPGGGTPIMPQQMGGLFGGGPPPQMSPLQGMGLGSPFFRPMPNQGFTPSRTNAMSPQAMTLLGMDPNMPNMVGPTSALPPEMQPQASQLKMYGMNNQNWLRSQMAGSGSAAPAAPAAPPALPAGSPAAAYGDITDPNILMGNNQINLRNGDAQSYANPYYGMTANPNLSLHKQMMQLAKIQQGLMGMDSGYGGE
jgi:hypothetical protein